MAKSIALPSSLLPDLE